MELTPDKDEPLRPVALEAADDRAPLQSRRPPRGGLPLGAVLGAAITAVLALLLGSLTALQLHREERAEMTARQGLLAEVLAPLAAETENAPDLDGIERVLSSAVSAEIDHGRSDFQLVLRDQDGRLALSIPKGTDALLPKDAVSAQAPVLSTALASGRGTLTLWQNDSWISTEMAKRRRAVWIDICITMLVIGLVVQLMIYILVSRPMNRLLVAFDKVEQGYPVKVHKSAIARELRWLEWRFHRMNACLNNSARLLVAAHRRAMDASRSRPELGSDSRLPDALDLEPDGREVGHDIMKRYLRDRCALLEQQRPGDPPMREIALQAWKRDAVEAEKLGEMELRARVENAALKVLDPVAFERVHRGLEKVIAARRLWCHATSETIQLALAADGVPLVAIQRRSKHAAGVWRKMRERNLDLEDVADILAFRVIVPTLDDCYLALDTVHRLFEPEPFRFKDYIADPKTNGYQSIHTSVHDRDGFVFEVQIRTVSMHHEAEEGGAAHWRYREKKSTHA